MSGLLQRSRKPVDQFPSIIGAFESDTQAVIGQTSPYSDRALLHAIGALFAIGLLLISVLKVDRVVVGTGKIVPTAGSVYIQPIDKSVVRSIVVHVGDVVKKGQLLATLDPTFTYADVVNLRNKHASDMALVARLEAEQAGVPFVPKADDKYQLLQLADWRQRQTNYHQSLADFDARIAANQSLVNAATADLRNYSKHQEIAADLERRMEELEKSGYGATIKTLSARDTHIDANRQVEEAKNQAEQALHNVASLRAQRDVFVAQWRDTLATSLLTARNDLNTSADELAKAERLHELGSLTSPVDAVVLQIGAASVGSVVEVTPGAVVPPLFTLTPIGGPLEADVSIPARDVGFVKAGQKARIKLDAYRFIQHGTADGVVKTISEGSFTTDDNGQKTEPYFKARIEITKVHLRNVPKDFRLVPGMTLSGDVLIGKRTIMSYLVEGAMRTGSEAMREP